jgi:glycerophosphoryl diester phosphodiesterase
MPRSAILSLSVAGILLVLLSLSSNVATGQVIVGHRGASFDAPENTLAAFQEAWAQNADGVEGDFYVTKDQQIVCIHDADTKRTAGRKLIVAESTLKELRVLEYGGWKGARFLGEPIPTFAEVLATIPKGKLFVIELKTGPEIVPLLKAELKRLKAESNDLLIIAFKKDTVAAVREELPEIRVHWLTGFKQDKNSGEWHPTLPEVIDGLKETQATGIGFQGNRSIVTAEFLAELKKHGLKEYHVWTVDELEDARHFRDLGVIGITTNRPAFIRDGL